MNELLQERENGTCYLGDLDAAKAYLREYYNVHEERREDGCGATMRSVVQPGHTHLCNMTHDSDETSDWDELMEHAWTHRDGTP